MQPPKNERLKAKKALADFTKYKNRGEEEYSTRGVHDQSKYVRLLFVYYMPVKILQPFRLVRTQSQSRHCQAPLRPDTGRDPGFRSPNPVHRTLSYQIVYPNTLDAAGTQVSSVIYLHSSHSISWGIKDILFVAEVRRFHVEGHEPSTGRLRHEPVHSSVHLQVP
jgi:hypothetical protein